MAMGRGVICVLMTTVYKIRAQTRAEPDQLQEQTADKFVYSAEAECRTKHVLRLKGSAS